MENLLDYLPQVLTEKTVFLTDLTSDVGKAIAKLLAKSGAHLFALGQDSESCSQCINELRDISAGPKIYGYTIADDPEGLELLFDKFDTKFTQLDILIFTDFSPLNANFKKNQGIRDGKTRFSFFERIIQRMGNSQNGHIIDIRSLNPTGAVEEYDYELKKTVEKKEIKLTILEIGEVGDPDALTSGEGTEPDFSYLAPQDIAITAYYCMALPKRCSVSLLQITPYKQAGL